MSHDVKYTMGHTVNSLKVTALVNPIYSDSYQIPNYFSKKWNPEIVSPYPLSMSQPVCSPAH